MSQKRPALGRGLSALIQTAARPGESSPPGAAPAAPAAPVSIGPARPYEVDLDLLEPNGQQPRSEWDDTRLDELAQSIKSSGVIQPILVRPKPDGRFEIIAGERRWRAAQRAGLLRVPVVVRDVAEDERLELALIENIQRENLTPIEEARAYKRLSDELRLTQEEIAGRVGRDRATVANYQRLLTLPVEVQADVNAGTLSMGHARAIVGLADAGLQRRAARDVRARALSVRETEALVKKLSAPPAPASPPPEVDVHVRAAEQELRRALGTTVRILTRSRGKGRIELHFGSQEELQRLYEHLTRS